ncbi:peroxisomal membrane protein PEX14-like [Dreissena polymorpha]|uniref:Peroxisomal membrane protein PEX14 n=1 Tax=Dreissena polymorpha TaxID=45954 RepID=A0A9D4JRU2_DREPO|nr:peroxisomal membrane protein PEX14-like [Dreissena polymorpha]KAH3822245.1 hypothetical protein DPMN_124019 [Dreissena polymorpha]
MEDHGRKVAPGEPVSFREDLVATAVKFLQNPKVQQSSLDQRKAFLQKKGLTNEEVEEAVQRAGCQNASLSIGAGNQSVSVQGPVVPSNAIEKSGWTRSRELLGMVAMVAGLSYAAHRLYKEFLRPWLFGGVTDASRLEILEKLVNQSNERLAKIEVSLDDQKGKLQGLSHDVNRKSMEGTGWTQAVPGLSELKTELSSIKGLLLNRRQFPPVPSTTPILPSWQLASNSGDADSNKKGSTDGVQEIPKITFSASSSGASPELHATQNSTDDVIDETVVTKNNSSDNEPEDFTARNATSNLVSKVSFHNGESEHLNESKEDLEESSSEKEFANQDLENE